MDLTVVAYFSVDDGLGSMAEYIVLGAARVGHSINVIPLGLNLRGSTDELREIIARSRPEPRGPVLYHTWPQKALDQFLGRPNLFISTMYESDHIPPGWPDQLNQAAAVVVATRHNRRIFRECGVRVPLEVVPDGVDSVVYHYHERPDRPLTTLMVGMPEARKNVDVGIAAWFQAFEGNRSARLIIKSKNRLFKLQSDDPRIEYVDTNELTRGIAHWYQRADVLMALGNEGFGLPLIEAMATGLPVIALNCEGQSDVCEDAADHLLAVPPARWENCPGMFGMRGVPDPADVARRLRWIATHRAEAREMGRSASAWVLRHRDVWRKGPAIAAVVERYAV